MISTEEMNKSQKIFFVILTFFVCFIITNILSFCILNICGINMIKSQLTSEDVFQIWVYKIVQMLGSILIFIVPAIIISKFFGKSVKNYLNIKNSPSCLKYLLIILFMTVSFPILSLVTEWNSNIHFPQQFSFLEDILRKYEDENNNLINLFFLRTNWYDLIVNILIIALIPAIGEEMVFRGLMQKYFIKFLKKPHVSIIITAFIFSAIHFSFFGFISRFILGIFLGYLAWRFNSLLPSIFAHFVNNFSALIITFVLIRQDLDMNYLDEIDFNISNTLMILAMITVVISSLFVGFLLFRKEINKI